MLPVERQLAAQMRQSGRFGLFARPSGKYCLRASLLAGVIAAVLPCAAVADEGGVGFWLPGLFGSLAALPTAPGWSFATFYYHSSVRAGGGTDIPQAGTIRAGIEGEANLLSFGPTYTMAQPVLGGQAAFSLLATYGRSDASVAATLSGPGGNVISGERSQTLTSYGDIFSQATLKWNNGVHNTMVYLTGNIPVGDYDPDRLANLGLGHGAIDGGFGYTYFNPNSGLEFSAVAGMTYNFENTDTDYQNGIDGHIDWGASKFVTERLHIGAVGYLYQQLTDDSGDGATLGGFRSRVAGIGPQIGWSFPAGRMDGYVNLKGYHEFAAENRTEGWNLWLTVAFSPRRAGG
jgi:hypothetical protein